jgi:hypothetical protein
MNEELKVTNTDDLQKVRKLFVEGEVIELPAFESGEPFVARLKRLSLLELCKSDVLPNQLLGAVQEMYEGKQRSDLKKYAQTLDIICAQVLIEPAWEAVKDIITDTQKVAIFTYSQHGVAGLIPFRKLIEFQADNDTGKK